MSKSFTTVLQVAATTAALFIAADASAAVKFRIGFDSASNQYSLYMTPDSVPAPDMTLSAQATLVVPHGENEQSFTISNITSHISNVEWANHSRVDAPEENTSADYISLGYFFTGSNVPKFGWEANQEKKILSFTSSTGCVSGVKLIDNNDPFSQLPNSAGTNPGNDFMNIGWQMSNAYVGNYGEAISCTTTTTCKNSYLQRQINTLSALKLNAPDYMQASYDARIASILNDSRCQ
ncbi:MAG: cadherin [Gammaproteobacteria bacterium]|nr:cadherin [Gammaproteobacteria bacterium]MBU1724293.1 cadherin [Gammaproteobacteria bacterium]MBU2006279.1 cadherin [Gammaproteobacteria bacterium]